MKIKKIICGLVIFALLVVIVFVVYKEVKRAYRDVNFSKAYDLTFDFKNSMYLYQKACFSDKNGNGIGEFPSFAQLKERNLLPEKDMEVIQNNVLKAHGYYYVVYTPQDVEQQEKFFVIYGWPIKHKVTSYGFFHVNQYSRYVRTDLQYSGLDQIPPVDMAYIKKGKNFEFGGKMDGNWSNVSR